MSNFLNKIKLPKTVAIIGLGASGIAAAELANENGINVILCDDNVIDSPVTFEVESYMGKGKEELIPLNKCDMAVVSPGVPPTSKYVQVFEKEPIPVVGEIEFASYFSTIPIIGITGTNGKTTTTRLAEYVLKSLGKKVVAGGNIGLPYSEIARRENSKSLDFIILELSSFQLERIEQFTPDIAVWLNFAPDHLDRYIGIEDYKKAKLRIFENQTPNQVQIIREGEVVPEFGGNRLVFSSDASDKDTSNLLHQKDKVYLNDNLVLNLKETSLRGKHNAENVMAVIAILHSLEIDLSNIEKCFQGFVVPPHRAEFVKEIDEVEYINDSKATNLHALESAIKAWEKPIILIVGGKQKGLDYAPLKALIKERVKAVFTMGEIGEELCETFSSSVETCKNCNELTTAIIESREIAQAGDIVLFSPGTSSFDQFSGYEERGNSFKNTINQMI